MRIQISSWEDYLKWREGFIGLKKPELKSLIEKPQDFYEAAEEALINYAKKCEGEKNKIPKVDYEAYNKRNQGIKESEGKLFYELDWNFITQMAERMSTNDKYPVFNWKKYIDVDLIKQAMFRHMIAIMNGELEDGGREVGHIEALATGAMILNYQLNNYKKLEE